ncbi:hypothetical protein QAD02_002929 [Eretmocerus hayati]|uniref:Uncharacterized protein n=1 Tax=Eretmocerus hayati TaxID=131215 RepID=A0ACC2NQ69_9HYME|nr:hypothetical protein QAD02_002929 [Eretmocerus hayati]
MSELNSSHNASAIANDLSTVDHHMGVELSQPQGFSMATLGRLFDDKLAIVTQNINANTNEAIQRISEDINALNPRVSTCGENIELPHKHLDNYTRSSTTELASTVMYEIRNM